MNSIGSGRWDSTLVYKIPSWKIMNGSQAKSQP